MKGPWLLVLSGMFRRFGCVRIPDERTRRRLGPRYKKGYEIRLVANSITTLAMYRRVLGDLGFKLGKPYVKRTQIVQPIYGKAAVERFLEIMESVNEAPAVQRPSPRRRRGTQARRTRRVGRRAHRRG